jgi:hypothetical protein
MFGTSWLLSSLPQKSGIIIFNLDFRGEDLGILCTNRLRREEKRREGKRRKESLNI